MLSTHLHLALRLRISGAVPPDRRLPLLVYLNCRLLGCVRSVGWFRTDVSGLRIGTYLLHEAESFLRS
jgi:hypothetical protein